jgi:biopolymer transport protein ExbD
MKLNFVAAVLGVGVLVLVLGAGIPVSSVQGKDAAAVSSIATWVWVHSDGSITCDGQRLSLAQLQQRVNQLPHDADIHVKADSGVPFEAVGRVVYMVVRHTGVTRHTGKMGFLLEPREDDRK